LLLFKLSQHLPSVKKAVIKFRYQKQIIKKDLKMKKYIGSLIVATLLGASLYAQPIDTINYQDEFKKMNTYINSIIQSHMKDSSFADSIYPRVNIQNKEDRYIYEFDLASMKKEDIKLSINEENILTLEGSNKKTKQIKETEYVKQEIFYGSFKKVMKLPDDINQDKLTTKYDNGILILDIPKKETKKLKTKMIEIK
jgi:HSP20 family protein